MSSTSASTDPEGLIIIPKGELDPRAFEAQIRSDSAQALSEGRLHLRSFPDLFELSLRHLFSESERLLNEQLNIVMDVEMAATASWLVRLKLRLRSVFDRLVLYYALKLAHRQRLSAQQLLSTSVTIAEHMHAQERSQRERLESMQAEINMLREEIKSLKGQGRADHAN